MSLWHISEHQGRHEWHPFDDEPDSSCSHLSCVEVSDSEIAWLVRVQGHYDDMQIRLAELKRGQSNQRKAKS